MTQLPKLAETVTVTVTYLDTVAEVGAPHVGVLVDAAEGKDLGELAPGLDRREASLLGRLQLHCRVTVVTVDSVAKVVILIPWRRPFGLI